jgi:2-keto-4-pentenoate hydratase/2-oxohepta-3-ene-1,7-dioic acid hydratase in catechol pathway
MKLVRFGGGRIGVVREGKVYDVSAACGVDPGEWPPVGMVRVIGNFDALRPRIEAATERAEAIPLSKARLETPIAWPNKLLAFPVNYVAHGVEMKSKNRADLNGFFMKANSALVGPNDRIVVPEMPDREFHHECELAMILGKHGRHVSRHDALDYVFGYACLIDVTLRGSEERVMRKSFDTFCPVGPWITTADEIADPADIDLKLWVNGELRQHANTRDLIVDIPGMVAAVAAVSTIEPGDIIATGTPAGVGPIRPGDTVAIEIAGVGRMELPVVAEAPVAAR